MTVRLMLYAILVLPGAFFTGPLHAGAVAIPTVTLVFGDSSADEAGPDTAEFTVTRTAEGMDSGLNVYLELGGSAVRTQDYNTSNLFFAGGNTFFIQIQAGQLSRTATITPIRDNRIEGEELVTVTLLDPQDPSHQYTVGAPASGQATIADDVAVVTLSVDDGAADEAGQDTAMFTVTRTDQGNTGATLSVYLQLGGSAVRTQDYNTSNLFFAGGDTYFIQIQAGQLSRTATITPIRDNIIEGEENVTFALIGPQNPDQSYTLGAQTAGQAAIADDVAEVTVTVDDGQGAELGADTASATVHRTDQGNTGTTLSVYLQLGGSAIRTQDYNTSNLFFAGGNTYFVQIQAGQLSRTVTFTPLPDADETEGEENITLSLIEPQNPDHGYVLGSPSTAEVFIRDFIQRIFMDGFETQLDP